MSIVQQEQAAYALRLRAAGFSIPDIATRINKTEKQTDRLLSRAIVAFNTRPAEEARTIALAQLDALITDLLLRVNPVRAGATSEELAAVPHDAMRLNTLRVLREMVDTRARLAGITAGAALAASPSQSSPRALVIHVSQFQPPPGWEPPKIEQSQVIDIQG